MVGTKGDTKLTVECTISRRIQQNPWFRIN
jgi:hypothetical protein